MKKANKIVALLLCVLVLVAAFAGCGEQPAATGTDAPEEVELILGVWPDEGNADAVALHEGYLKTFQADEAHANVNVIGRHYEYALDTFAALAEAGSLPTVYEPWFTEPQKIINNGYAADITENLAARGWDKAMSEAMKKLLSDEDGNLYGMPRDAYALGLMVNAALFREAGLVDADGYPLFPQTWEDVAEYGKTIKEKTGKAGLCLLAKDNAGGWHFSNIAWNFGADDLVIDNGDGTYKANCATPEAIAAMQYIWSLKWEYDILTDDPTVEDWGTGFVQLGTGEAAMYIAANDAVGQPTAYSANMPIEDLGMCAVPAGPNGDRYSLAGGTVYMFSDFAASSAVDAALDYLEIMGKGPVVSEGLEADFQYRVDTGIPVIKSFPLWVDTNYVETEAALVEKYKNVDEKMYAQYIESVATGNLHAEEEGDVQKLYAEFTNVMQEVITNKDSYDKIPELMKQANDNYQTVLNDL